MKAFYRFAGLIVAVVMIAAIPARAQGQEAPLGSEMPLANRSMTSVTGSSSTLGGMAGDEATVLVFWSNQCPWVDKYEERMQSLASEYSGRGVSFVLVNANDPEAYPQEAQAEGQRRAQSQGYTSPYVIDGGSELANALGATRTPHVYVFDSDNQLVYIGSIDDSPGDPANAQRRYLRDALDSVLADQPVSVSQTKAFGCTIRYQ